ncbi:MAG: OmpA family protein [Deltaproteobacteria bacterium]|nr:OmpA family protein [Deltaproteobacteria bacterium]
MRTRGISTITTVAALALAGCGYSEEEMRSKLREVDALRQQLSAEGSNNRKFQRELDEARAQIEQLRRQLSDANVDVANLKSDVEEKAKALEEFRRRAAQLEEIKRRFELLRAKLQDLTKLGLKVTVRHNKMVIELPGDVLFDSGRETLKVQGEEILLKVADIVRRDAALAERDFQVAGHTDNESYGPGPFRDNWGLSVMRAREVLAFLIRGAARRGGGLDPKHWSAAGYGDNDPVAPNTTPEGRQANRRCELIVVPKLEEMLDLKSLGED